MGQVGQCMRRRRLSERTEPPQPTTDPTIGISGQVLTNPKLRQWHQRLANAEVYARWHANRAANGDQRPLPNPALLPGGLRARWFGVAHPPQLVGLYTSKQAFVAKHGPVDTNIFHESWPSKAEAQEYMTKFQKYYQEFQGGGIDYQECQDQCTVSSTSTTEDCCGE